MSSISLVISIYNTRRDRGVIFATSQIYYDQSRSLDPKPSLKISVVNKGRRPVTLKYLWKKSKNGKSATSLNPIKPITDEKGNFMGLPELVAQSMSLKLEEGDIFEKIYHSEDWVELLVEPDHEEPIFLLIEDTHGKMYPVNNSNKNIKTFIKEAT